MTRTRQGSVLPFDAIWQVLAIPCNFLAGFLTGLVGPIVAIAGIVAIIRLVTGKVPFLSQMQDAEDGTRRLTLELVDQERAGDLFGEHKERIAGELGDLQAEIRAIVEQAKAQGQSSSPEESE